MSCYQRLLVRKTRLLERNVIVYLSLRLICYYEAFQQIITHQGQTHICTIFTNLEPSSYIEYIAGHVPNIANKSFWAEIVRSTFTEVFHKAFVFSELQGKSIHSLDNISVKICADVVEVVLRKLRG